MAMQPHQERVVTERDELQEKLTKLAAFFPSKIFAGLDESERLRLTKQLGLMEGYRDVLNERIAAF